MSEQTKVKVSYKRTAPVFKLDAAKDLDIIGCLKGRLASWVYVDDALDLAFVHDGQARHYHVGANYSVTGRASEGFEATRACDLEQDGDTWPEEADLDHYAYAMPDGSETWESIEVVVDTDDPDEVALAAAEKIGLPEAKIDDTALIEGLHVNDERVTAACAAQDPSWPVVRLDGTCTGAILPAPDGWDEPYLGVRWDGEKERMVGVSGGDNPDGLLDWRDLDNDDKWWLLRECGDKVWQAELAKLVTVADAHDDRIIAIRADASEYAFEIEENEKGELCLAWRDLEGSSRTANHAYDSELDDEYLVLAADADLPGIMGQTIEEALQHAQQQQQ